MISIFLARRDFLFAGEKRDLAHLRQVHANRIVDALGGGLGEFFVEVEVDFLFFFILVDGGFVFGRNRSGLSAGRGGRASGQAGDFGFLAPLRGLAVNSATSCSSMSLMPISSIIISKLSSLSGETTSSGSLVFSSS